jgi:flagellar motility protein MotE (MotC chaperone)
MGVMLRPRLLPVVVIAATMLLGFKVSDLVFGNSAVVAPVARAQAPATSQAPSAAPNQSVKTVTGAPAVPDAASSAPAADPETLNPSEIGVLQQLAQRRAALDQRAGELDQRDILLQATEKRIDDKIAKLQELQNSIASDVQKRSAEDDARIQSLVKIYEAMKPKDAAQIFEQLDMPVLLSVFQRMKELKSSPILAAMDPVKAKAITMALAAKHGPDTAQGGAKSPSSAPTPKL